MHAFSHLFVRVSVLLALAAAPAAFGAATSPALIESLRGLVFVGSPEAAADSRPAGAAGIDTSQAPLLQSLDATEMFAAFLGQPVTTYTVDRIAQLTRIWLRGQGEQFVLVYLPPQDVTDGVLRFVVTRAKLEGEVTIEGARYFSAAQYRNAVPLAAGGEIDAAALQRGVAHLNQNPFRRVTATAEAGEAPGTTRLALEVEEQFPLRLGASYDNTGSVTTGEHRVGAHLTWGNALWRGDQMSYRFSADSDFEHLESHSGNYTTILPSRHVLTLQGAWSRIESLMPAPLTQAGHSWQVGAHYAVPLRAPREGWTQNLAFTADFKYSDNTLEFAAVPITDNVTHIVQFGATYGVSFMKFGGHNSISLSGCASPGGLTRYNRTSAFDGSRPGAKACYIYGKLAFSHRRPLPHGFSWITSADAQFASTALLGTEQLSGSGSYAVRGYRENTSFGDWGVIVNNELHLPPLAVSKGRDHVDLFAFVDVASLNLNVDEESTDLRSAGVGLNYQFGRWFSVRASYGWQMKRLDNSEERSRGHISANVSF